MRNYYEVKYFVKKYAGKNWKLQNSMIPYCDLTFILEGEAVYTSGGKVYSLHAGEAVFLPAGSDRYAKTTGMQCVAFNFTSDMPVFDGGMKIVWYKDMTLDSYFTAFGQSWNTQTDIDRMKCSGLFMMILSRVLELQQVRQGDPHVRQMKAYLHKHYTEKITVRMIAEQMHLNPVYCGALFSKEVGDTILNYTNQLRIVKAKELLQCTNDSISQVAADVGIEDLYYFSRLFKKITGVSPQQYRLRS